MIRTSRAILVFAFTLLPLAGSGGAVFADQLCTPLPPTDTAAPQAEAYVPVHSALERQQSARGESVRPQGTACAPEIAGTFIGPDAARQAAPSREQGRDSHRKEVSVSHKK